MSTSLSPGTRSVLNLLKESRIRELNDVVDLAALVSAAVIRGDINGSIARELRQWTELMYTCLQSKSSPKSDGDTNFITQLIQIAGGPGMMQKEPYRELDAAEVEVLMAE